MKRDSKERLSHSSPQPACVGDNINPALKSWISNCVVPLLVKEYLASLRIEKDLAAATEPMAEFRTLHASSDEVTP